MLDAEDGGDEGIDFLTGIVEGKGGAAGAFDAQAVHQGLGTMVARAHGNAEAVEQGAHVEVVDSPHLETDDGIVMGRVLRAVDFHTGNLHHALHGVGGEVALMGLDKVETYGTAIGNGGDVVERTGQAGAGHVVGRAGLEFVRQVVEGGMLEGYGLYHLATAHVGRYAVEPRFLAVEHTDASGTVDFVPAEGKEVTIQVLHVDAEVGRALCAVDEDGHAVGVGNAYDFLDGIDGAEHVADVGNADDFGPFIEQRLDGIGRNGALVGDGQDANLDALPLLKQLPRNDVGVVFHLGDEHFITLLHECLTEAGGHEIDALRGAAGKDNFARRAGIEEAAHRLAGRLVEVGGLLGQEVYAPVDVGVHIIIFLRHGLHHLTRFLRSGGVVEIDEGVFVVYLTRQDREIGPYPSPDLPRGGGAVCSAICILSVIHICIVYTPSPRGGSG